MLLSPQILILYHLVRRCYVFYRIFECCNPIELRTANSAYEEKLKSGGTTDQTMFSLSWDVEELKNISVECTVI